MPEPTENDICRRESEIRQTRLATLIGAWELVSKKYRDLREGAWLSDTLAAETVERYLTDRQALISRHNIKGRIQRHKIAGLMTASIVKVRPVQLIEAQGKAARVSKDNEILAVWHGLAICGEGNDEGAQKFLQLPLFGQWLTNAVYFLRRRHDCAESCSLIFETISLSYFPDNLTSLADE